MPDSSVSASAGDANGLIIAPMPSLTLTGILLGQMDRKQSKARVDNWKKARLFLLTKNRIGEGKGVGTEWVSTQAWTRTGRQQEKQGLAATQEVVE